MRSVIKILLLSIFLFVNFSVFGKDIIPEKQKKEMIRIGSKNLNELIVQNRINDETNSSNENVYLFYTYNSNEGDVKDPSKLLSDAEFKTLNDKLVLHNQKLEGKAKIYVALNGKIIYTIKNEVKLSQGQIKLSDLKEYSTESVYKKVKEELAKVYGNILNTAGTSNILISSLGWFSTVSLANVINYNLQLVEKDYEEKVLKNKIYIESFLQFNLHYKKGDYLTDVMFYNINSGVPTDTKKNIRKYGVGSDLNSALLTSNLEKLNTYFFEFLSDPTNNSFCEEGDKFFNAHSEIKDEKIKNVIVQISSLICDPEADPKFFDEFNTNQYESLFAWQKDFYNRGIWSNDYEAYEAFRGAYERYIQYFKDAKGVISTSEDKDALLKISYDLTLTQLKKLTADEKLKMLKVLATGVMGGYWTSSSYNTEALALKIIESITNDEGEPDQVSKFITGLTADAYKIDKTPLYKELFKDIDDFFGSPNFTKLILKFTELTLINNGIDKSTINSESKDNTAYNNVRNKTKLDLVWDVQNRQFLWLFNVVKDNSEIKVTPKNENSIVNIKQYCKRTEYVGGYGYSGGTNVCTAWETDKDLAPFDLVSLNIINDITFSSSSGACGNTNTIICGEASLVPAVFMMYLNEKRNNTIVQNVVTNTLTVASFYFSGAEILAARGALTLATLPAYIDLFVTITNPYFSGPDFASHASSAIQTVFSADKEKADELAKVLQVSWTIGSTVVTLSTAKDLSTPKKHMETIAMYKALLKKTGSREKTLAIMAKEKKLAESAAEGLEEAEKSIRKSAADAKKLDDEIAKAEKKIEDALSGVTGGDLLDWTAVINKPVKDFDKAPKGYIFYTLKGNKWIRRKSINDPNTPRLTVKDGKIIKFEDLVDGTLAKAWKPGWNKKKILDTPKGSRPKPSDYLDQKYINQHIAKFDDEGGAFVVVKSWIEGGSYSKFPLKKYAMLKSDMTSAVSKYKSTGKVEDLEDALGYSRGDLAGLEHELFVFFPDKSKYKFEMPDGNEIGANSLWDPGGKTSGGFREAVLIDKVDPSAPIEHNKSIETLKSIFSWEKL